MRWRTAGRTQRRFFEQLTPGYWQKETFVCQALDDCLPQGKPKQLMRIMEVEPTGAQYWSYLKPMEAKWYIEEIIAVGATIDKMDDRTLENLRASARGLGSRCSYIAWSKPTWPFGIEKASVDMALVSDGAFTRLGARLETALLQTRTALKKSGRFMFVVNEEDERVAGGPLELDFYGKSVMDQYGFEIVTSKCDCGLRAGYMVKKPPKAVTSRRSRKMPRTPRAY